MPKHYMAIPFLSMLLGGMCLSLSAGYNNRDNNPPNYPQNIKPGVSDDFSDDQQYRDQGYRHKRIAYMDERDRDIHRRANRKGDWGYKQNWRYDRDAFFRGETQGEAYEDEHPEGTGGIGIDPDREFLQMRHFYLEESRRARQNDNRSNPRNSFYSNNRQNNALKNGYAHNDHPYRNASSGSQNNASQNKNTNNRFYYPNNFDNVIADNYFDNDQANNSSKYNASKQNSDENNAESPYHPDHTPRYYYYYE